MIRRLLTAIFLYFVLASAALALLQFQNFMVASPFSDGKYWVLVDDLQYDILDTDIVVTVPRGFVTDFTSIPRPFWSLLPRWGKYGPPAVVHDFLYWDQRCTRAQADKIMMLAMQESDVSWLRANLIHKAVRLGGLFAWRSNRKARESGVIRWIPNDMMPENPNVTWKEYETVLREAGVIPQPQPSPHARPDYCMQADESSMQHTN